MNEPRIKPQFTSIPFKASSPNGITEYNGIAKFSPAGIVVEFESKLLGLISDDVKEVKIPLGEIIDISFRKGIFKFSGKIRLRLNNFATISRLPNDNGEVKLKIKRKDFEIAERVVGQMQRYINEGEADFLSETAHADSQLPPTPVSVSELFDTEKLETKDLKKTKEIDNFTR